MKLALALACSLGMATVGYAGPKGHHPKLDDTLNVRASGGQGISRVIVTVQPGRNASAEIKRLGGKPGKRLDLINGQAAELPNALLKKLADLPSVVMVHLDRKTGAQNNITAVTTGSRAAQLLLGYKGRGVGVAVIDSGITGWHDDLTYGGSDPRVTTVNGQRVAAFADFVNGYTNPYDDYGHGTHVAGIIAGNGKDSWGARAGMAPEAHLVGLKVLNANGNGVISDVIAAIEYAVTNKAAYNIRVINLSVGAAVTESFNTDPLAQAAKKAVEAGIVVVAAAGNLGHNKLGQTQYGGITAPGNAPWVLTVGASSHMGTVWRYDDTIAGYSSRGPSAIDFAAKPDLVAPGTGIVSLSDPNSTMYATKSGYLEAGTVATGYKPYLSLTGTSMAAPVVSGTVAQMLEANPNLTPNLVKAILQYTAQPYSYDALTQGAGFLNSYAAVQLAKFFANAHAAAERYPIGRTWSRTILWGNHRVTGGVIKPSANAWSTNVTWGASADCDPANPACENIVWGTVCDPVAAPACENVVWGNTEFCDPAIDPLCENIVWGTAEACDPVVDPLCENIVWGTTLFDENVVWGTQCGDADCENVVWGTSAVCDPTIDPTCENIVWGTSVVCDPAIDPTCENIVWGTDTSVDGPLFEDPNAVPVNYDNTVFVTLFAPSSPGDTTAITGGGL